LIYLSIITRGGGGGRRKRRIFHKEKVLEVKRWGGGILFTTLELLAQHRWGRSRRILGQVSQRARLSCIVEFYTIYLEFYLILYFYLHAIIMEESRKTVLLFYC
jgi:hypothetical protein